MCYNFKDHQMQRGENMTCRLIRITSKPSSYKKYCEVFQKTEYSILGKGQELPPLAKMMMRVNAVSHTWSEKEFLEIVKDPNQVLFFFETNGKINGFSYIVYKENYCCDIVEFTVHDKGKGLGRIYFNELLKEFSKRKITSVRLQCPPHLQGAQAFWRRIGFHIVLPYNDIFEFKVNNR